MPCFVLWLCDPPPQRTRCPPRVTLGSSSSQERCLVESSRDASRKHPVQRERVGEDRAGAPAYAERGTKQKTETAQRGTGIVPHTPFCVVSL